MYDEAFIRSRNSYEINNEFPIILGLCQGLTVICSFLYSFWKCIWMIFKMGIFMDFADAGILIDEIFSETSQQLE